MYCPRVRNCILSHIFNPQFSGSEFLTNFSWLLNSLNYHLTSLTPWFLYLWHLTSLSPWFLYIWHLNLPLWLPDTYSLTSWLPDFYSLTSWLPDFLLPWFLDYLTIWHLTFLTPWLFWLPDFLSPWLFWQSDFLTLWLLVYPWLSDCSWVPRWWRLWVIKTLCVPCESSSRLHYTTWMKK